MTLIGNRPEWVLAMMACFRIGAVVLPCTEQLRAKDLRLRLEVTRPSLIVADERNRAQLEARRAGCQVLWVPDGALLDGRAGAPSAELRRGRPVPDHVHERHRGRAQGGGARTALPVRPARPGRALAGARAGDLVWCTAASGWSKSARNAFIAPWLMGATALLHDARFDPDERLDLIERERVNVLCMAPTEYRVIAKRATLRALPT